MPLQDLTPQLRTRLNRLERLVGLFVTVATLLMLAGLGYYIYHRAASKGWFLHKLPYFTFVKDASGLKVGDKVMLMGFDAGEILEVTPQPPNEYYDVFVRFQVREPYYGYLWESSRAKIASASLLGSRGIEVTKGTNGAPTYLFQEFRDVSLAEAGQFVGQKNVLFGESVVGTNGFVVRAYDKLTAEKLQRVAALGTNSVQLIFYGQEKKSPTGMWSDKDGKYVACDPKGYFLLPEESPALTERIENLVNLVETNVPGILDLTNKLAAVLSNAANAALRADALLLSAQPMVTNLAEITAHLRDPKGSLGDWLLPTNLNAQLNQTLAAASVTLLSANTAVTNTDERLGLLVTNLNLTLENLAGITSNLNTQVQANSNILATISQTITDADTFIQGLKRHWLLRSAFKEKGTNAPPAKTTSPSSRVTSPKGGL